MDNKSQQIQTSYLIRQETKVDYPAVYDLIERAFAPLAESDHDEHRLVERLRQSDAFIPQLSLVAATADNKILGHVLLTKAYIVSDRRRTLSLAVAPLSVSPEWQRQGIGGALLREAHQRAADMGYGSALLLGHPGYYPRFGYRAASLYGIRFPFEAPDECCMAIELLPDALKGVQGMVEYAPEFGIGSDTPQV